MKSKNIKKVLLALLILSPILIWSAVYEGNIIDKTAAALDFTQIIDLSNPLLKRVSMQAIYSDGTPAAEVLTGGAKATANITVVSFAGLAEKRAQVTITVASNTVTALTGAYINLNGALFRQGIEWEIGASSVVTGRNISNAIDLHPGYISTHTLSVTAVVTASAAVAGTYANSYSVTSSTPAALVLSHSNLFGGQDNATIHFPTLGVMLTQGTDWTASISNNITAESIEEAIAGNSILSAVIVATHPTLTSVVYSSTVLNGAMGYPISLSTSAFTLSNGFGLAGGRVSSVDLVNDVLTLQSNTYTTGLKVLYSTSAAGSTIIPLTGGTTYFAIYHSEREFKVAHTATGAAAGLAMDLIRLNVGEVTYTFSPLALSTGPAGFYWRASNDGTNFSTLNVSSVTIASAGMGNTIWDFAEFGYRYLQLVFTGPTNGGIALRVRQYGKDN